MKEQDKTTLFTGKSLRFKLPRQFLLPLVASLRAAVKYDESSGKVGWYEKPEDVFIKCKYNLMKDLMTTYKSAYHNEINRASKDSNLWRILFLDVEKSVDQSEEWKMYNVPR